MKGLLLSCHFFVAPELLQPRLVSSFMQYSIAFATRKHFVVIPHSLIMFKRRYQMVYLIFPWIDTSHISFSIRTRNDQNYEERYRMPLSAVYFKMYFVFAAVKLWKDHSEKHIESLVTHYNLDHNCKELQKMVIYFLLILIVQFVVNLRQNK